VAAHTAFLALSRDLAAAFARLAVLPVLGWLIFNPDTASGESHRQNSMPATSLRASEPATDRLIPEHACLLIRDRNVQAKTRSNSTSRKFQCNLSGERCYTGYPGLDQRGLPGSRFACCRPGGDRRPRRDHRTEATARHDPALAGGRPGVILRLLDAADDAVHDPARDCEPWVIAAQVLVAPQDGCRRRPAALDLGMPRRSSP
jgi:hypothetical protein